MRVLLLVFAMGLCAAPAFADENKKQKSIRPLNVRLASVRKNCAARDWSKVKCGQKAKVGDMYERFGMDLIHEKIGSTLNGLSSVSRSAEKEASISEIYRSLIADLSKARAEQKLSDCQSACMIACTTSELAVYDYDGLEKRFETEDSEVNILLRGAGACRHYATVAATLTQGLGIEAKYAASTSGNHAFLGVKAEGKWLYIEPQVNRCEFFTPDETQSGMKATLDERTWWESSDQTAGTPLKVYPTVTASTKDQGEEHRSGDALAEPAWTEKLSHRVKTDVGPFSFDRLAFSAGQSSTGSYDTGHQFAARFSTRVLEQTTGRSVGQLNVLAGTGAFSIDGQVIPMQIPIYENQTEEHSRYRADLRPLNAEFQLSTDGANSIVISPEAVLGYRTRAPFMTSEVDVRFAPLMFGVVPTMNGEPGQRFPMGQNTVFASRLAIDGRTAFAVSEDSHVELSMGIEKLIDLNRSQRLPDTFAIRGQLIYARNFAKGGAWHIGVTGEERPILNNHFLGVTMGIRAPN